jgi:adenine-specific DNA-methyltransferase
MTQGRQAGGIFENRNRKELGPTMTTGLEARRALKVSGAHYTPAILAEFVARQIAETCQGSSNPSILDPGVGDGELLLALLKALDARSCLPSLIAGYDTDAAAIQSARQRIEAHWSEIERSLVVGDFLQAALQSAEVSTGSLFAFGNSPKFDVVIANPPYVRTQVLGAGEAQRVASLFGLSGRVDLYFAFLLGIAHVLKPGGVAGVIVSNRFTTTRAGAVVRQSLRNYFDILHVWDLGDTRLFAAAVLPAILLLRRRSGAPEKRAPRFTAIYSTPDDGSAVECDNPIEALQESGPVRMPGRGTYRVRHGQLHLASAGEAVWRLASEETDVWLATVEANTYCSFGEIGKVRVGVKTTADKVFIRSDWSQYPEEERPELLRPLTTHHAGRRFRALSPTYQIVYPHETVQGKRMAVDLSAFPRTAKYLAQHRAVLESRQYVIEAGRQWYEIWVPQDPDLWVLPKVVFRDIAERPTFWMDLDGTVVNGDCYWMAGRNGGAADLLWLALAVANSTFIEAFYDHRFNNKLYAGRRRFMTQFVEQFPVPVPSSPLAAEIVSSARTLWRAGPDAAREDALDRLVWSAFGLPVEESLRQRYL